MNLLIQARIAESQDLILRAAAAAAASGKRDPLTWAKQHAWQLAITDGWCCAVADATNITAASTDRERADISAITDGMVATAVAALIANEPPEEELPDTWSEEGATNE